MDDDDDDAHLNPYHPALHHLYDTDLPHGGSSSNPAGGEQLVNDDGEDEDDDEDEDENLDDDEEDEDEDEGDQEHQEYEQDFELEQSHQRSGNGGNGLNGNGNLRSNATSAPGAAALALYQPESNNNNSHNSNNAACPSGRIEAGDKHSVRDDWTEGATQALLEAWGDRYVELNKGNLKQEDWEEVAEVVSKMSKSHKTDVQCKNRLDTLKKKYKVEKHKQSAIGSLDSKWPFYKRLDQLLSATVKRAGIPGGVDAGIPVKSPLDKEESNRGAAGRKYDEEDFKTPNNTSTSSQSKESAGMTFSSPHDAGDAVGTDGTQSSRKRKVMETPFKTLAKAITKFGEIYEKMEHSKQQQLMDLEKIRMEFTRDLELQRMQLFMQTQVELAKMKHGTSEIDPTISNLNQ